MTLTAQQLTVSREMQIRTLDLEPLMSDRSAALISGHLAALLAEIDRLRTDATAALLPDWEAVYEPGNVSTYLIGYANDEAAAKGAAEAWLRSQAEVTGRLEWQPWGTVTDLPDGYDAWLELAERHDDGIDTGPGIVVRRRAAAWQEPARTLTESEHNRAWHAIEGAAGEEGADPGTVLNAVLRALGLNPPAKAGER